MIPKIIAKGTSFKGAAAYLLHDKGSTTTSQRVAWTETRNLMVEDDPDMAWRIMAATAMDQGRLKEEAGIKNTGRRSAKSVLHLALAWHPEENDTLTREEMLRAADGALKSLGANDLQVLIIAHTDEKQPHVHILCNRVSPEDGRMLSSSNDRLKLSEWAEAYELERGKVYCEDRVINNQRRSEGEYVKGGPNRPRHIVEAEEVIREAVNDNPVRVHTVFEAQKAKDFALAKQGRNLAQGQKAELAKLQDSFKEQKQAFHMAYQKQVAQSARDIGERYAPLRKTLNQDQAEARTLFDERESQLLGKARNAMDAFKVKIQDPDKPPQSPVNRLFEVISSEGARRDALQKAQAAEHANIGKEITAEKEEAKDVIEVQRQENIAAARDTFQAERADMLARHTQEQESLKEAWRERTAQRNAAYQAFEKAPAPIQSEYNAAAKDQQNEQSGSDTATERLAEKYERSAAPEQDNEPERE